MGTDIIENKLVSLIMPCYNSQEYLKETLNSILGQTYRPIEFIFVNDGSTDGSEKIYKKFEPRLNKTGIMTKYISIEHSGQAKALSEGLQIFTGDYLTWADSDDILLPENISRKVDYLENNKSIDIVRNNAAKLYDGIISEGIAKEEDKHNQFLFEKVIMETTYVFAGCYMMRRELFLSSYPDRNIPFSKEGQNLQMLVPPTSRSICGYIDDILMIYRIHEGSHSFHTRSLKEILNRTQGFDSLLKELMRYCDCNQEWLLEKVRTRTDKAMRQITYGLVQQNKSKKQ